MKTDKVNRFFDHLNNVDSNASFTIKLEQNDKLGFLDALGTRAQERKLATEVY